MPEQLTLSTDENKKNVETYTGFIVKVLYGGEDWSSVIFRGSDGRSQTAAGNISNPSPGDSYIFYGRVIHHEKYGKQIQVEYSTKQIKRTRAGMIKYFTSPLFPRIGEKLAERLLDAYSATIIIDVIKTEPEKLLDIRGMTQKKLDTLVEGVNSEETVSKLMELTNGALTQSLAVAVAKVYEERAVSIVTKNPYQLIYDINGIGFMKADKIALDMGFDEFDMRRIKEALLYCLKINAEANGHVYDFLEKITFHAYSLLFPPEMAAYKRQNYFDNAFDEEALEKLHRKKKFTADDMEAIKRHKEEYFEKEHYFADALEENIEDGTIIYEAEEKKDENGNPFYINRVYSAEMYQAETGLAKYVKEMIKQAPLQNFTDQYIQKKITEYECLMNSEREEQGLEPFYLADEQKEAVKTCLQNRFSILTGGPGCGKTTITDCVLYIWESKFAYPDESISLSAPTGRAAQRMKEATNRNATTIHRNILACEFQNADFSNKIAVIDEASMLDIQLAYKAFKIYKNCQLILVGDVDQLPSVGPGSVLRDLCNCSNIPITRLTKGHRNGGNIAKNAHLVNDGKPTNNFSRGDDFEIIEVDTEVILNSVVSNYKELLKEYSPKDIGVLCAQKKNGNACVDKCNEAIKCIANPKTEDHYDIPNTKFRIGDRVMNQKNHHDYVGYKIDLENQTSVPITGIYNGDCGEIVNFNTSENTIVVMTDDNRCFDIPIETFKKEFVLAYAITIHKSQGSEYTNVIIPFTMQHFLMLKRNILYTGITRAKKKIKLLGSIKALNIAIKNTEYNHRNCELYARITG